MVRHVELSNAQARHGEGLDFKRPELRAVNGRPANSEPLNGQGADRTGADRTGADRERADGNSASSAGGEGDCESERPRLKYLLHRSGSG